MIHLVTVFFLSFGILIVKENSADFHGKTANLDKRMAVAMVVAMEIPVNFGYGPHLKYPALPWKQACIATAPKYPEKWH